MFNSSDVYKRQGTSRAIQLDELVGAMGSLAIVISGVLTVVIAPIMAGLY